MSDTTVQDFKQPAGLPTLPASLCIHLGSRICSLYLTCQSYHAHQHGQSGMVSAFMCRFIIHKGIWSLTNLRCVVGTMRGDKGPFGTYYLESQWLIMMGYFKPRVVYFGV